MDYAELERNRLEAEAKATTAAADMFAAAAGTFNAITRFFDVGALLLGQVKENMIEDRQRQREGGRAK